MNGWWATNILNLPDGTVVLCSWVVWIITSICLHELAHGWMALRCGDSTPRDLGHMTMSPMVHMGPFSLLMFAMTGIAWGAMPVNPSAFRRKHDDALVAIAGPMMNLLIAFVCVVGYILWLGLGQGGWTGTRVSEPLYTVVEIFFRLGAMLNVVLMLFNLIPVPPLDGSKVVMSFFPPIRRAFQSEGGGAASAILFIVVFFFLSGPLSAVAFRATGTALALLEAILVPNLP
jgi:Zn-dependent protease